MDRFTREHLIEIYDVQPKHAISIYMPTYRSGREVRQNSTRLKNVCKAAEEYLTQLGVNRSEAENLLQPARRMHNENDFWSQQSDGLAMFLAAGFFRWFHVPVPFQEQVVVARRFHLTPILPLLEGDGRFYILAVSQKIARLLEGSHFRVRELHPDTLPSDLRAALNIDEFRESLQHHSSGTAISVDMQHGAGARGGTAAHTTIYHGQGAAGEEVKKRDELLPLFQRIDRGLASFFRAERTPLVFAGVEYLFPIFRQTCNYKGLIDQPIHGNPDRLSSEQLHRQAWSIVEPVFQRVRHQALDAFGGSAASGLAKSELAEVLAASRRGQVDTLFVSNGKHVWGRLDENTGQITHDEENRAETEDLLNYAALETLRHGGIVYTLEPQRMPNGGNIAAVLRYPVRNDQ